MALMSTPEKDEEFYAPDFTLKNIDGTMVSLSDVKGQKGTLVMFICNHCPYVVGIIDRLPHICKTLQDEDIGVIAVMSNDTQNYPADSFENMKIFAEQHGFTFPYVLDETQEVAKAYDAICTPDFFGFNADNQLQYRGRLDSAGHKSADENTSPELYDAMMAIAKTGRGPQSQTSSMGCSIKWK
jgi:peroxiredoxin